MTNNIHDLLKDMKAKYPQSYRMYLQFQCDAIFETEDKLGMFFSSHDLYDMPFQVAFSMLENTINRQRRNIAAAKK